LRKVLFSADILLLKRSFSFKQIPGRLTTQRIMIQTTNITDDKILTIMTTVDWPLCVYLAFLAALVSALLMGIRV